MFPPRTVVRSIVACTLACGLLATATSSAVARQTADANTGSPTSSPARTTAPPQDLRSPDTRDAARGEVQDLRSPDARDAANADQIARMMENYDSTYSEPKPVTAPAAPAPNDSPFLLISVIAGGLALVLASTALVLRRRHPTTV